MFCFSVSIFAQIKFESSLDSAFILAKQQNKIVFIEYFNADCPHCKQLEPLLKDTLLARFYNVNFINYRIDTKNFKAGEDSFILKSELKINSVPGFLFFFKDKKFCHFSSTKQDIQFLISVAKNALNPSERAAGLEDKYSKGDRSIKTLFAYSNLLELYGKDSVRNVVANDLYEAFPKRDLGNKKSYIITKTCVSQIANGFFKYWYAHRAEMKDFETGIRKGSELSMLQNIADKSFASNEKNSWNLMQIEEAKEIFRNLKLDGNCNLYFWERETELLIFTGDGQKALKLEALVLGSQTSLKGKLYILKRSVQLHSDSVSLKQLQFDIENLHAGLSRDAAIPEDLSAMQYLKALVLVKLGKCNLAGERIKMGIDICESHNLNTKEFEALKKDCD